MSDISDDEETNIVYGLVEPKVLSRMYEFYISGAIGSPEEYIRTFNTIRHATEDDIIKMYINSGGGDLFTAIQFLRVTSETPATVICSVEGLCCSAATLIFLNADIFEVTPNSVFMYHNYTSGTFGKGGEQYDQILHERKWSEALLNQVYKDFLSKEEITSLLANKDIWMTSDEVVERMQKRIETRKEKDGLQT